MFELHKMPCWRPITATILFRNQFLFPPLHLYIFWLLFARFLVLKLFLSLWLLSINIQIFYLFCIAQPIKVCDFFDLSMPEGWKYLQFPRKQKFWSVLAKSQDRVKISEFEVWLFLPRFILNQNLALFLWISNLLDATLDATQRWWFCINSEINFNFNFW